MSQYSSHNPDVLSRLANLSSDEVFTPPVVVNKILDELPASLGPYFPQYFSWVKLRFWK